MKEAQIELEITTAQSESSLDVEFAKKSRQVAITDYRRAKESNQRYQGVVSDREMDRLKLLVEQSEAEVKKIEFEKSLLGMQKKLKRVAVEKHQLEVDRHDIKSIVAGQIVEVNKRNGEWLNLAETVFKVVRLDEVRVEEYLPADVANSKIVGSQAEFLVGDERLKGQVTFVSPEINPLNSTVLVWVQFQNPQLKFRPGQRGSVNILSSQTSQISVPKTK